MPRHLSWKIADGSQNQVGHPDSDGGPSQEHICSPVLGLQPVWDLPMQSHGPDGRSMLRKRRRARKMVERKGRKPRRGWAWLQACTARHQSWFSTFRDRRALDNVGRKSTIMRRGANPCNKISRFSCTSLKMVGPIAQRGITSFCLRARRKWKHEKTWKEKWSRRRSRQKCKNAFSRWNPAEKIRKVKKI